MIRQQHYLIVFFCFMCFATSAQSIKEIKLPQMLYYLTAKDTIREAIFKYDKKKYANYGFDKNSKPTTLSKAEIVQIIRLIKSRVALYNQNKDPKNRYVYIKKPEKYYKQIIPVINAKGEKEVWVACSCSVIKGQWDKGIGIVDDGGICFFQLKINLTKNLVYNFFVNGLA